MIGNPVAHAAFVADLVARNGATVTLEDGTKVKAVVDERPDRVAREMPLELDGQIRGRPALFDFPPGTAIAGGDVVTYDDQKWRLTPARSFKPGDVAVRLTFYGTAGAVK